MTKTISATEAKQTFGALIGKVQREGDSIIIENRGEPAAVIISFDEFENLLELKAIRRREEAMETLRELRRKLDEAQERESEAFDDALIKEISDEVMKGVVSKSSITFEN